MRNLTTREKLFVSTIVILLFVVSVSFFFYLGNDKVMNNELILEFPEEWMVTPQVENVSPTVIIVDVKGAVQSPGVYELSDGSRVIDAIERAGGLQEEAASLHVNFAQLLQDEMLIYIPFQGEEELEGSFPVDKASTKISINKATQTELETLPGIGPAKATAIISYREENGPFRSIEDLLKVTGIGQKSLEKIQDVITIN